ncbi:MAG: fibronectin type III domain-containing protein [Verrucomicrobia bacterium]|nr:fibronectin type III domain-containing protein [Verrucomicrobiota bacterium]
MKNTLPKSKTGLIAKATVVISALNDHADAIGLLHVTANLVEQKFMALQDACGHYDGGKLEMTSRKVVWHSLIAEGRAFSMTTRDVLKPHLGNKYGEAWNGTGFVNSLTVPSLGPELLPLLLSLGHYLALRPAQENALLNITTARAKTLATQLGAARAAVLAQEAVSQGLFEMREHAANDLRETLRMLLNELAMKLSPLDPLWMAFGFNMPGKRQRPAPPTNVVVTRVSESVALVKWDKTPRAEHHRVWVKVLGVHAEPVAAGSPADLDFLLEPLPHNVDVEIALSAVNSGGESARSEPVILRT